MTDISQLRLARLAKNKVDEGWSVVTAHIDVVEVPKLLLALVECLMSLRKPIASVVAEPNVVPRVD